MRSRKETYQICPRKAGIEGREKTLEHVLMTSAVQENSWRCEGSDTLSASVTGIWDMGGAPPAGPAPPTHTHCHG